VSDKIIGVTIGLVKEVDDQGRLKLYFPVLELNSDWARVAVPMAGKERGFQFMPEVDDEVLVAFDQGDVNAPYVLGYLWNGVDKAPQTDAKIRTLKTVSGHLLEFDDTGGSEKVSLKFMGGNPSIVMEQSKLTIAFDDGNTIEMSASGVKVKGTLIELN